jgi:hypothetical protein
VCREAVDAARFVEEVHREEPELAASSGSKERELEETG